MKRIVHVPNEVLSYPAQTVTSFDKSLERLVADLKETLIATRNPKGVGLAAPQVGVSLRVFVTRPKETDSIRVFINPEIIKKTGLTDGVPARNAAHSVAGGPERENKLEGCLSIPKIWGRVKRAKTITLTYQDEKGATHEEKFSGFLATIIQHETDHVNGILYTQRVLEQKGKLYQTVLDKDGKEELEEIKIA